MAPTTKESRIPTWPLHDRLRRARLETGLTAAQFADEIGVSADSLRRWEAGSRVPARPIVMAYALRCDVPIRWLFGLESEAKGDPVTGRYLGKPWSRGILAPVAVAA